MKAINDLLRRLASLQCKGKCQESCGPLAISHEENEDIYEYCETKGIEYWNLTSVKNLREGIKSLMTGKDVYCPFLNDGGKCSIYPVRPMICRLWGMTSESMFLRVFMLCPHGCSFKGDPLTQEEANFLLDFVERNGVSHVERVMQGTRSLIQKTRSLIRKR